MSLFLCATANAASVTVTKQNQKSFRVVGSKLACYVAPKRKNGTLGKFSTSAVRVGARWTAMNAVRELAAIQRKIKALETQIAKSNKGERVSSRAITQMRRDLQQLNRSYATLNKARLTCEGIDPGIAATPVPTAIPQPTVTPIPTAIPTQVPTPTPTKTSTPTPTSTPVRVQTPIPTITPTRTPTPMPTPTVPSPGSLNMDLSIGDIVLDGATPRTDLYVVSKGAGTSLRIKVAPLDAAKDFRAMIRIFDPDGDLVAWEQREKLIGATAIAITNLKSAAAVPATDIKLHKVGVYEVRIGTSGGNAAVRYNLPTGTQYGVAFSDGTLKAWADAAKLQYAWIPRNRTAPIRLIIHGTNDASMKLKAVLSAAGAPLVVTEMTSILGPTLEGPASQVPYFVIIPSATDDGFVGQFNFTIADWTFKPTGVPIILSPDADSARAIHGSIERIASGTLKGFLVNHKFQLEIARLMPKILAKVGNADTISNKYSDAALRQNTACTKPVTDLDAFKNSDLLGTYMGTIPAVRWALQRNSANGIPNQDVSLTSPWAGAIGGSLLGKQQCNLNMDCINGGVCQNGACSAPFSPTVDRWDAQHGFSYIDNVSGESIKSIYGGLSLRGLVPYSMAFAATVSTSCNGWGPTTAGGPIQTPELVYRAVAASFANLLAMDEGEFIRGVAPTENTFYSGYMGFISPQTFATFGLLAPKIEALMTEADGNTTLGASVRKVWTKALQRFYDANYNEDFATGRNQNSHHLVGFEAFSNGLAGFSAGMESDYRALTRRWALRFFNAARAPGYFEESMGPDSSYVGMTLSHIAEYLGETNLSPLGRDVNAAAAIQKAYRFFNHTVAVEPTGKVIGGFNFGHRIGEGFETTQYNGAKFQADEIPEVGVWSKSIGSADSIAAQRITLVGWAQNQEAQIAKMVKSGILSWVPKGFFNFKFYPNNSALKLPSQEGVSFVRKFPDVTDQSKVEMYVFKTPKYFAAVYVGKPAGSRDYLGDKNLRQPATNWNVEGTAIVPVEDRPGNSGLNVDTTKVTPFVGGGLSIFSTPQYGAGLVSTNWSAVARHGLLARVRDPKTGLQNRYWEDYFDRSWTFDAVTSTMIIEGGIESTPLRYIRTYKFLADKIDVSLEIRSSQVYQLDSLVEVVSIPTCTASSCATNRKVNGAQLINQQGKPLAADGVDAFGVRDTAGKGVAFVFDPNSAPASVRPFADGLRSSDYGEVLQVGRVEIDLTNSFGANSQQRIDYSIRPDLSGIIP